MDRRNGRAVSRTEFLAKVSELIQDASDFTDLWENDVCPVAVQAFNDIMRSVRGGPGYSSLAQQAGIVQFEKWLRDPVRSPRLPLKTAEQLRWRSARLRQADRAKQPPGPTKRIDQVALAQAGIASAAGKARLVRDAREIRRADIERRAHRWRRSHWMGTAGSPDKRWQLPPLDLSEASKRHSIRHATMSRRAAHVEQRVRGRADKSTSWLLDEHADNSMGTLPPLRRSLTLTTSMSLPSMTSPAQSGEEHLAQVKSELASLKEERLEIIRLLRSMSSQDSPLRFSSRLPFE
jgi:hypothetical protein